jgi:hypothetical protein
MGFFHDCQPPFPLFVSNPRLSNHLRKLNHKWDETQTTETQGLIYNDLRFRRFDLVTRLGSTFFQTSNLSSRSTDFSISHL